MFLLGVLQTFMPTSNAYCFLYLLIVLSALAAAYIYLLYLFREKWTALFGAVVVGLSPFVVGHSMRPEINSVACIPLTLCLFAQRYRGRAGSAGLCRGAGRAHDLRRHVCIRMSGHLSRRVLRLFCRLKMAQSAFLDDCDCLRVYCGSNERPSHPPNAGRPTVI